MSRMHIGPHRFLSEGVDADFVRPKNPAAIMRVLEVVRDRPADFRGRQIVTVKGHPEKLEVSRSYTGLFKGM